MNDECTPAEMTAGEGFADIDRELGRWIARVDGRTPADPHLERAAACVSRAIRLGHSCLHLDVDPPAAGILTDPFPGPWPPLDLWHGILSASPVAGPPGSSRPLIFDAPTRLYLARYYALECEVARRLLARTAKLPDRILDPHPAVARAIEELWSDADRTRTEGQTRAASLASRSPLTLISGGAGTGKTWTILKIVELTGRIAGTEGATVALAAPTGKAAARLTDILRATGPVPGAQARLHEHGPMTIHRLLGVGRRGAGVRRDADHPLPVDLVVVDEASMIDLELMARLLRAVPEHARLVLVGDRHQLPSVEAGSVFADLCDAAEEGGPLAGCLVELTEAFRFAPGSTLARLCGAIRAGAAPEALALLDADGSDVALAELPSTPAAWADTAARAFGWTRDTVSADQALRAQCDSVVLTPVRRGPWGVRSLNDAIARAVHDAPGAEAPRWEPILVTRNAHALRLYNGDLGVIDCASGRASFRARNGQVREIAAAALPPHERAYALTVHKAQGSEFGEATIVLAPGTGEFLTRQLLYTAAARARARLVVWGDRRTLQEAIERAAGRASGLAARLLEARGGPTGPTPQS